MKKPYYFIIAALLLCSPFLSSATWRSSILLKYAITRSVHISNTPDLLKRCWQQQLDALEGKIEELKNQVALKPESCHPDIIQELEQRRDHTKEMLGYH